MWRGVISILLAVPLPAPFGDAEASALSVSEDGSAVVEIVVEVAGVPSAVLVRGAGLVDELPPVALVPRGDGTYGGIVELNSTVGVLLGFEYLPAGGGASILTDVYTLVQLGVDPAALAGAEPAPGTQAPSTVAPPAVDAEDSRWGWLALAAGAAGLALLLVWLLMGKSDSVDKWSGNADNSTNADNTASRVDSDG